MTPEQVTQLLQAAESDQLERKASLSDSDAIRDTFIQFANDLAGRGGGHLIVGQAPDKTISGLTVSEDEAQQKLAAIARDRCKPSIPIIIECHGVTGHRIAIVDIRATSTRPHFTGNCFVRVGSTKRIATDAEIMALRYAVDSSDTAKRAATAAEDSATAAKQSASVAATGMQISQRAYLGTIDPKLSAVPNANQAIAGYVTLKNCGNSPALNVRVREEMGFLPSKPLSLSYPDSSEPGFDLAPGAEDIRIYQFAGGRAHVDRDEAVQLEANQKHLFIWGWARYCDIFGDEHSLKWCYEYSRSCVGPTLRIVPAHHKMEQ